MKKCCAVFVLLASSILLASCGGENNDNRNNEAGIISEPDAAISREMDGESANESDSNKPDAEIDMEIEIDGKKEIRKGTLVESDNGYSLYTLQSYVFTAEEPGIDQVFMESYPESFMRIQPLGDSVDLKTIRANAEEEMKLVGGEVTELKGNQIEDEALRSASLYLRSSTSEFAKEIIVLDIDGQWFKFILHMPAGDAAIDAGASYHAMIKTVKPI